MLFRLTALLFLLAFVQLAVGLEDYYKVRSRYQSVITPY